MKWVFNKDGYTGGEKIVGIKYGISVEILPVYICSFPKNEKDLASTEMYFKEDGYYRGLNGDVFDKRGNMINDLEFFNLLKTLNYPAFISKKDLNVNCPFFNGDKEDYLLYNRLNVKVFDNIEKTLNIFILEVYNYLKNCLNDIDNGLISFDKKQEFKKYVYSVAHLAKYIKQTEEIQDNIRDIKSIRKFKNALTELIKYIENEVFIKSSPYCIEKQTIIYDFSDIDFYGKNTIKLTDYRIEIGMEDFLNRTLQNVIEDMLTEQAKSEKEHFEKGRDLLFGLANGDIAPNDFFK